MNILCICGDWSEDYELAVPYHFFRALGHTVHTTTTGKADGDYITTCIHDLNPKYQAVTEWAGHRFKIDVGLNSVDPDEYDMLLLPGGRACETLRNNPTIQAVTSDFIDNKKLTTAICRGSQILFATGKMKGYNVTGNPVCEAEAKLAGAHWKRRDFESVVVDDFFVLGTEFPGLYAWLNKIYTHPLFKKVI
ncbi:DJ-1/PfpI family protein [Fangia hongkongensis]|uniref:DJ-1/PfpI family protein n=1 Tax=Fangia hongkongensis TaxID=270495 RepID=UPI000381F8ED|nr:DJ-1/PfpI family protein [Fangia hongkongensis]MBK2125699.1 DJ-1/PfpI family protein [Fangia hongkongensis]